MSNFRTASRSVASPPIDRAPAPRCAAHGTAMTVVTLSERRWRAKPCAHVALNGVHVGVPPCVSMLRLPRTIHDPLARPEAAAPAALNETKAPRLPRRQEASWSPFYLQGAPSKRPSTAPPAATVAAPSLTRQVAREQVVMGLVFDERGRYIRSSATASMPQQLPVWTGRPPPPRERPVE